MRISKLKAQPSTKKKALSLVAIGASAGGLEAVSELLKNIAANNGMAYFYIQHLSPDHASNLPLLLSAHSRMVVTEAKNSALVKANHVYVCAPNKEMAIVKGRIQLKARNSDKVPYLPIDSFFKMISQQYGSRAIGVILSGNATDGTIGLKAIKDNGGVTFAQDDSARNKSMPTSAIKGNIVDYILSPQLIGRALTRLGRLRLSGSATQSKSLDIGINDNDPSLASIFQSLERNLHVDFSHYKLATIKRRLNYRMINCGVESLKEYAQLVAGDKTEAEKLHRDLLINVTSFFRDPPAFKYLKETIFPKLLRTKAIEEPLRIWVPACSTGEEAFSLAMLLYELQQKSKNKIPVQIFATDLSIHAIKEARNAKYSATDLAQVSVQRRKNFFVPDGTSFRVMKEIREMCVFAPHNLLNDPPFSRMDFISCCNLLIYFDADAQKRALATLRFALNDTGFLMLAKAESTGESSSLFIQHTGRFKIYRRKSSKINGRIPDLTPRFSMTDRSSGIKVASRGKLLTDALIPKSLDLEIDSMLLAGHMPPCVIVSKDMEILKFRGASNLILRHAPGNASLNLLKMVEPELTFELAKAMRNVIRTGKKVSKSEIKIVNDKTLTSISFEISPVRADGVESLYLVVFNFDQQQANPAVEKKGLTKEKDKQIKILQDELRSTRLEMHEFIESQDLSHADLQAANEEIVSTNEEFQTLNEELETSKEEMQATNEELITTNQELQMRNSMLNESYKYSEAIIATIHEPILVLDTSLLVKSANEAYYKKFQVTSKETVEHSIYELGEKQWDSPVIRRLLSELLSKNTEFQNIEIKQAFPKIGEKVILLNAKRIVQKSHGAASILMAIEDITERYLLFKAEKEELKSNIRTYKADRVALEKAVKKRTKELGQKNIELEALVEYATMGIMVVNEDGKIVRTNPCLDKIFGYDKDELIGSTVEQLIPQRYAKKHVGYRQNYKVNPHARVMGAGLELFGLKKQGSEFPVEISLSPYSTSVGNFVISFIMDISARKESDQLIREKNRSLEQKTAELSENNLSLQKMNKELETFTFVSSHDLQEPLRKIRNFVKVLRAEEEKVLSETGKMYLQRTHETAERMQRLIEDLLAYSRSKKTDKIFEPVQIGQIIEEVREIFSEKIREQNISLVVSAECTIDVIRFQFRQLFQNLVGNSIKFSDPARPLVISVGCELLSAHSRTLVPEHIRLDTKLQYCHIIYRDTGIGFSAKYSEKIFEVFQRLHSQEMFEGTGMGLAICKRIVENHDGEIWASGSEGVGALFNIYIPCRHKKKSG